LCWAYRPLKDSYQTYERIQKLILKWNQSEDLIRKDEEDDNIMVSIRVAHFEKTGVESTYSDYVLTFNRSASQSLRCSFTTKQLLTLKYTYVFNAQIFNLVLIIKPLESYPRNRPWRPIGLRDVEDSTLSRQSAHRWQ
jgi:hypothetical protein